jgi:hypothetical protein
MQSIDQRSGAQLSDMPPRFGIELTHLVFDLVQCGEMRKGLLGELAAVIGPQLVELASRVGLILSAG